MTLDQAFRVVIELLVMSACGMWMGSLRHDWLIFTRRARRVSVCVFGLLLANAYAILVAITTGRPVTSATWLLFIAFFALNAAMVWRPADDNTTNRQYVGVLRRFRLYP